MKALKEIVTTILIVLFFLHVRRQFSNHHFPRLAVFTITAPVMLKEQPVFTSLGILFYFFEARLFVQPNVIIDRVEVACFFINLALFQMYIFFMLMQLAHGITRR